MLYAARGINISLFIFVFCHDLDCRGGSRERWEAWGEVVYFGRRGALGIDRLWRKTSPFLCLFL
jgi:hypothetical protein